MKLSTASLPISRTALTRWAQRCLMVTLLAPAMPVIANAQPAGTSFTSTKSVLSIARSSQPVTQDYAPANSTAVFPGDQEALQNFLKQPGMYPHIARETGMEGTVKVQFRVLPDGTLTECKVVQSAGLVLDRAALLMVSQMPKWIPAYHEGRAVRSVMVLPILFQLD